MVKENNMMTFTKRLNYSVKEVSVDEFLSALADYSQKTDNQKQVENIQIKLHQVKH